MSQYGYESAEIIQHLSEYLQTVDLSNVQFVISGYQQFTARELKLIEVLMAQFCESSPFIGQTISA